MARRIFARTVTISKNRLPRLRGRAFFPFAFIKPLQTVFFGAGLACGAVWPANASVVTDIRSGETRPGVTRLVIEVSEKIPFQVFTLDFPERIVIDMPEVEWKANGRALAENNKTIKNFRHGLFREGVTRVVIDMNGPVNLIASLRLAPNESRGHRFYVDFMSVEKKEHELATLQTDDWANYSRRQTVRLEKKAPAPVTQAPEKKDRPQLIVLDPGHGGVDPGAISTIKKTLVEKNVVLAFSQKLKKNLEETKRYKVILTRDRDVFIPLRDRYRVAHESEADLFISIHADSIPSKRVRGLTVYTLSEKASDAESAELALQENQSDLLAGHDLTAYSQDVSSILIDLLRDSTDQKSWQLAQEMIKYARRAVPVSSKPHRSAGFAVLKSPTVPSLLIELGYMTNEQDVKNLQSKAFNEKVSKLIIQALDRYFKEKQG